LDSTIDAARCACGYVFDGTARTGSFQALELAIQEAELYAEYLLARVSQLQEGLDVAIADSARHPEDEARAALARKLKVQYSEAEAEHEAQAAQVALLRRQARQFAAEHAARMATARATQQSRKHKAASITRQAAEDAARDAALKRIAAQKAERQARKLADAAEAARRTRTAARETPPPTRQTSTPPAAEPRAIPQATTTAKNGAAAASPRPNPAVREKLAAQAEQALARVRQQQSPVHGHVQATRAAIRGQSASVASATAADPARTPQARTMASKTARGQGNPAGIECPHCTALLPDGTASCRCGFSFPKATEQMPDVGLSSEDQAMLRALFGPTKAG
jgi:hypothetical protein